MTNSEHEMIKPVSEVDCDLDIVAEHQTKRLLLNFDRPTPSDRLACLMLGKYHALKNLETLRLKEKAAITALVAYHQPNNGRLLVNYQKMLDMNASAAQMAEFISLHLITFHKLPEELTRDIVRREAVARCAPALGLAGPTHQVLTEGGDDRLIVQWETADVNRCHVAPRPHSEMIIRSGSTASPPSETGFERADTLRKDLLKVALKGDLAEAFTREMESVRKKISTLLHLDRMDRPPAVIITSSGTDAELVIAQLALTRAHDVRDSAYPSINTQPGIHNIFIAVDEINPDKLSAGALRHFNTLTPAGSKVSKDLLEGVPEIEFNISTYPDSDGRNFALKTIDLMENALEQLVRQIIRENEQVAVLHLMEGSATGLRFPEPEFLLRMKQSYGKLLIAVADAAQMRCDERQLAAFLESGCCVILTGSKFIGGPPFSGAVLLPMEDAAALKETVKGLEHYISADDVDLRLSDLRQTLPSRRNYGLLLRWNAALAEMERYFALEPKVRQDLTIRWHAAVSDIVDTDPYLSLVRAEDAFEALRGCSRMAEQDTVLLDKIASARIVG